MKSKFNVFIGVLSLTASVTTCTTTQSYDPNDCLTSVKQQQVLRQMVRYANKLAPEATHQTKFNSEFDWYYNRAINESKILYCFKNNDDTCQILVARIARSITPMQEGIAIKIKLDENDSLVFYQEVFRMWKMPMDTLKKRGHFLFKKMIKNESLYLYTSKYQKDRFIEFPDDRFSFDVYKRRWRDRVLDTINFQK